MSLRYGRGGNFKSRAAFCNGIEISDKTGRNLRQIKLELQIELEQVREGLGWVKCGNTLTYNLTGQQGFRLFWSHTDLSSSFSASAQCATVQLCTTHCAKVWWHAVKSS